MHASKTCWNLGFGALVALAALGVLEAETAGGIRWMAPVGWKAQPFRPMRAATYAVGDGAECVVYYFGPGQGGSVEDNLKRWIAQFPNPEGKPQTRQQAIHGLKVTTVDVSGAYTGAGGPTGPRTTRPGYRLLGAIVEAPKGRVFFKFTGPAQTVAAHEKNFERLLRSLRR